MKPGGKIGFFDSGLGGLTILRHVRAQLPNYDYVYLGDTLHQPFGSKPAADVRGYVQQGVSFLFDQGCELVILSCNTAAAHALSFMQQQFLPTYAPHRHVLGVIRPTVQAALLATRNNRIGVIATLGTVQSHAYAEEIQELHPEATVYQQAAPELVSLIESGLHHSREMQIVLSHYLQALKTAGVDTLILGCAHYEVIAPLIGEVMGNGVNVVHQGPAVANSVQDYLFRNPELSHRLAQGAEPQFLFTRNADVFTGLGREFYGGPFAATDVRLP